ncbi:hypothetical protein QBC32DRAFT_382283 [Pseudoneurospora amorphoporcata]|uniref:Cerato-platanin n=1 Tax=Pseudoneurospora amorphoporcata TaxID=241081 RepID=A0AAN6NLF3_9PEZI|nr:hypothetical protein QBC32DRAFT_382283 [Pseudoneurospora amorphoporcata]
MLSKALTLFGLLATVLVATPFASAAVVIPQHVQPVRHGEAIGITPHDKYSSSVGVLGCKIDINRVAYWPSSVSCNDICVRVTSTATGRSVTLLKIDQSGGAHDISYDAYAYLQNGIGAASPVVGGAVDATYEFVDPEECRGLVHTPDGNLPANSMNFVDSCKNVGDNFQLWNIADARCQWGEDVMCNFPDLAVTNQPDCGEGHTLGIQTGLLEGGLSVVDVAYPV